MFSRATNKAKERGAGNGNGAKQKKDLFCVGGCGFYGNPEWKWYCSKCWREHQFKQGSAHPGGESSRGQHASSSGSRRNRLNPSKTHPSAEVSQTDGPERSPHAAVKTPSSGKTIDQNLKQFLSRGKKPKDLMVRGGSSSSSSRTCPRPEAPPEAKSVSNEFATFLNQRLDRSGVADVSRQIMNLIDKVAQETDRNDIEAVSNVVQEFYLLLRRRLETHAHFQALTDNERQSIMDLSEKYTMICSYKSLFCPASTTDEEKDLELQNRIRRLNWISTKDLACPIIESSQEVRDLLHEAINDILGMDGKMAPQDKLACLVKCCKIVFNMLQISHNEPASADDFLPCLIYICLKANPPRIQSNINFITRFCNEDKLRMGEAGYFFANLCCALSFIETMTAESINMNEEEFESYFSGSAMPPGSWQSSLLMCEGLQVMSQNIALLSDLKSRQNKVLSEALKLKEEMSSFQSEIHLEVLDVLDRTKYEIRGPKKPVTVDDDEIPSDMLPSPLLPAPAAPAAAVNEPSQPPAVMAPPPQDLPSPLLPGPSGGAGHLPSPLLPTPAFAADLPPPPPPSSGVKSQIGIEDFLSSSQASNSSMSLLDLSLTAAAAQQPPCPNPEEEEQLLEQQQQQPQQQQQQPKQDQELQPSFESTTSFNDQQEEYRGFSAQSSTIPSISCDNAKEDEKKE